ncbi:MAG: hypothetical protein ACTSXP_07010, partial [Promethearchaeota archaeon]
TNIKDSFPLPPGASKDNIPYLSNLARPLYVFGLAALNCLLAAQVYPLEMVINWTKKPVTLFLFGVAVALVLVFIPALTWTLYSFVVFLSTIISMLLGLIMNIGVNFKLAVVSTGDLRRRSIFIIFASFLFYLGFLWTLEIQEISVMALFNLSGRYDIVLGCIIQGVSALFYYSGLKTSD